MFKGLIEEKSKQMYETPRDKKLFFVSSVLKQDNGVDEKSVLRLCDNHT